VSAVQALKAARDAGVRIGIDVDTLTLEADAAPPAAVLDLLSRYKAGVVALLRTGRDNQSVEEWRAYFEERAAIAEFNHGVPRRDAEACAFECCVIDWLNRSSERTSTGRCAACGGNESIYDAVLPYGLPSTGHVWIHSGCWPAWCASRRAAAIAALKAIGIAPQADFSNDFGKKGGA
jgi:hypothetical protein